MAGAGKASLSRAAFDTGACLRWVEEYVTGRLGAQFNALFCLIGAVSERGDPARPRVLTLLSRLLGGSVAAG